MKHGGLKSIQQIKLGDPESFERPSKVGEKPTEHPGLRGGLDGGLVNFDPAQGNIITRKAIQGGRKVQLPRLERDDLGGVIFPFFVIRWSCTSYCDRRFPWIEEL